MARYTQIVVKSKESTELGFPKKFGVYHLGEARRVGAFYNIPLLVLRENELSLPRPPVQIRAESEDLAREVVIGHYRDLAARMDLDVVITEIPEMS